MAKQGYQIPETNSYVNMYEQFYFKERQVRQIKPIDTNKRVRKEKHKKTKNIVAGIFFSIMLFAVLPYPFKHFVIDTIDKTSANALKADYQKILFPTHHYLYKDLFLGKYTIKDTEYKNKLMVDINETQERIGLKNQLLSLANEFKRINPSVYVWDFSTGTYVDINANVQYPAASIIKIPVLIEMFRQIEAGKFSLNDTMVLEDYYRASGSGKLQYSQGGVAHTMDYLAKIMIENSDNSSTNMIMAKMGGMPDVNRAMKRWGLTSTHINNWLPDLDGTNITTARELGKMLYNIDSTNIINSDSKRHIAGYLSHVKNNRLLQAGLPKEATLLHKTGDIGFMVGDAGIVKTASGKKYIVVILAKRPYNNLQGKEFIVKASRLIYNHIN